VKLSARHDMVPDEQAAGPATAVVALPSRTPASNSVMQRMVSRHPAGPTAFAGGNRAVGALITQPKLTVSRPHDVYERQADAVADGITQESLAPAPRNGASGWRDISPNRAFHICDRSDRISSRR